MTSHKGVFQRRVPLSTRREAAAAVKALVVLAPYHNVSGVAGVSGKEAKPYPYQGCQCLRTSGTKHNSNLCIYLRALNYRYGQTRDVVIQQTLIDFLREVLIEGGRKRRMRSEKRLLRKPERNES